MVTDGARPARHLAGWWIIALLMVVCSGREGVAQVDTFTTLSEVDITGNRHFEKSVLMELIESRESSWLSWLPWIDPRPVVQSSVRTDMLRLASFYKDEGFLAVTVDTLIERKGTKVRVAFLVSEGQPVLIDSVLVRGDADVIDPGRMETRAGARLTRGALEEDRVRMLSALRDSGHAFARLEVKTAIDPDKNRASVAFDVNAGNRFRFGDVVVRGNRNVGAATIRRGVTFRPGAAFQQRSAQDARRQLYRSRAFRSVVIDFPDSLARDTTATTVVSVSERSLRSVKLGAGYDTQNQLNGSISWTHRSVFGGAQHFRIGIDASAILTEFRASLTQPYVFGNRNWLNFGLFMRSRVKADEFRQTEIGGDIAFERNIASRTTLLFETGGGVIGFEGDSLFVEFVTSFIDDHRDDFLDPSDGVFVRVEARQKGALFQSSRELLKLTAEGRWYTPLPASSVLASRVSGGMIVNLSSEGEIPNFERFFAGGLASVRGWSLDQLGPKDRMGTPVGGKSKFEGSIEIRTRLGKYLGTAIFLDGGQVDPQFNAFDFGGFAWAVGGGLRYLSPVGPIRLDAGRRLTEDDTSRWQYHFSIGQAF
ncbi:TPA: hypothetical protein DCE37_14875 [Candidatus Latescibacteria bacterium]|nr:hypothetical protein [Candidatus Latescibacterota bacterium]